MDKHISAYYIKEKLRPIQTIINIVESSCDNGESDNIADKISESQRREFTFAYAVISKELGEKIPDI